jgi:predicted DNA-binding protein YlxM (UPF0122 family)
MIIKTATMQRIEARYGKPIESLLAEMHLRDRMSLSDIARELGVTTQAISQWMRRCHLPIRRVRFEERLERAIQKRSVP